MTEIWQVGPAAKRDLVRVLCGDMLGDGMSRKVYELKHRPDCVVKLEEKAGHFQNHMEHLTWEALKHTPYAKWLAPVLDISPCGIALVMARTLPIDIKQAPKELPRWLTDFKTSNYGLYKGRVVCHDYGTNMLLNHGAFERGVRKLKSTDWNKS